MNEQIPPPSFPELPSLPAQKEKTFQDWLHCFISCNPFYLASALLLLFGCYRTSMDGALFYRESSQLIFNFTSLQAYELLVVVVAVFLASRRIWYDSTLLVGLENLLVFVPFIFISQAALIDSRLVELMCVVGVLLAILRFGALKRFFPSLNLPIRVLALGAFLLSLNVGLPLLYRHFGQSKISVHIDSGPAYEMNEYTWMLILPAAFALMNLLPHARETGSSLPQRRWLPTAMFSFWLVATSVHLYCLDYIYQFDLRSGLLAPTIWILAWTIFRTIHGKFFSQFPSLKNGLLLVAAFIPLLAKFSADSKVLFILTLLNIVIYLGYSHLNRDCRFVRHLCFGSALLLLSGLPEIWLRSLTPEFSRGNYVVSGVIVYLMFWTARLRDPRLAILGAVVLEFTIATVFRSYADSAQWAVQCGVTFLLLHSLRWEDAKHQGANTVRCVAGIIWALHSFIWAYSSEGFWKPCLPGLIVLGVYFAICHLRGNWSRFVVPFAAVLVIFSGPSRVATDGMRSMPPGLLAVVASFLFLACGTITALTKSRWHKTEKTTVIKPRKSPDILE